MKTVKKTATEAKTLRYEVSIPECVEIFTTNNKELAQEQAEKFKAAFANSIHFVDHKLKEHWYYERTNQQKNYRILKGNYDAPKIEVASPENDS